MATSRPSSRPSPPRPRRATWRPPSSCSIASCQPHHPARGDRPARYRPVRRRRRAACLLWHRHRGLAAGEIAPSEAVEIIAALDAHKTAITDLRRDGHGPAPTPEQIERRRRAAARQIEIDRSSEAIIEQLMNGGR
jgi:hypothetical protein